MNYINFLFTEIKSFICDLHEVYHSNDWDEMDCDEYKSSIHSYYTMASFYDVMGVYKDNENHNVNVEMFEYIYNSINTLFTNIYYLIFMNPFIDLDYDENDEKKKVEVEVKKIIYDVKYDVKYDSLEAIQLSDEELEMLPSKFVMESTPVGNVIMYFDYDKRAFQYYSDFSVPYKYLECVSKKYCIVNKNKIYRDIKMEVDVNEFSIVRNSSASLQNKSKSFAKLKGYNNSNPSNPSIKGGRSTKQSDLKIIQKDIVRYTHLGKICNFSFVKNTVPKFKPVSYKDFMKTISPPDGWVVY
jgi:hypothetical protein